MGAIKNLVRAVTKVIAPTPKAAPQTVSAPAPKQKAVLTKAGASAYGGSTIMSGAEGVEDEANVSKTILGGTGKVTKKKGKDMIGGTATG